MRSLIKLSCNCGITNRGVSRIYGTRGKPHFCAPYLIFSAKNYEKNCLFFSAAEKNFKKMLLLISGGAILVKTSLFFHFFLKSAPPIFGARGTCPPLPPPFDTPLITKKSRKFSLLVFVLVSAPIEEYSFVNSR